MRVYNPIVCKSCNSQDWKLFQEQGGRTLLRCKKCNRDSESKLLDVSQIFSYLKDEHDERLPLQFAIVRDKELKEIIADDIPPGLDPDDITMNPEDFVRI